MLQCWPFTQLEFGAFLKALWWYGCVGTVGSYYKQVGAMMTVGLRRLATARREVQTPQFDENDPRVGFFFFF